MEANIVMFLIGLMLGIVIVGYIAGKALEKMYYALRSKNSLVAKLWRQHEQE